MSNVVVLLLSLLATVPLTRSYRVCCEVPEGMTCHINCAPGDYISSIPFASYGYSTGGCGAYSYSACNSGSSVSVCSNACVGKPSCSVLATNVNFGDPCILTLKTLKMQAECTSLSPTPQPTVQPTFAALPLSVFPSAGFPTGFMLTQNNFVGVVALPSSFTISLSVSPTGTNARDANVVHFVSSRARGNGIDDPGARLPGIWFCAGGRCPAGGLGASYVGASGQYVELYTTVALPQGVWSTVNVTIDTIALLMSFTITGGVNWPTTTTSLSAGDWNSTWSGVQVWASDPWWDPALAKIRSLTISQSSRKLQTGVPPAINAYFPFKAAPQTFTVPDARNFLYVQACGGVGSHDATGLGGLGGYVASVVLVEPKSTLYVYVGGSGVVSSGYNGGGNSGGVGYGGGGTDLRTKSGGQDGSANVASRIVVAGGGGVGGGNYFNGGAGGGLVGGTGPGPAGGAGGTQHAGGSGFASIQYTPTITASCRNGDAWAGGSCTLARAGGGGYYGGGGGDNGGGGSSFTVAGRGVMMQNIQGSALCSGNGWLSIAALSNASLPASYYPSSTYPGGFVLMQGNLVGLVALPSAYTLSFDLMPTSDGRGWRSVIRLTAVPGAIGQAGDRLPGVWLCMAGGNTGTCPTLGLYVSYEGAPEGYMETSQALPLNDWSTITIVIDTVNSLMTRSVSGGVTIAAQSIAIMPSQATWPSVQVYASSLDYSVATANIRNLAISGPAPLPVSYYPSTSFLRGFTLIKGNLVGIVALPAVYTLSFDLKPSALSAITADSILHLTGDGSFWSYLPALYLCDSCKGSATTGTVGLYAAYIGNAAQAQLGERGVRTSQALPLNDWSTITVTIDAVGLILALSITGAINISTQSASLLAPSQTTWPSVKVYAASPWAAAASASIRNLAVAVPSPTPAPFPAATNSPSIGFLASACLAGSHVMNASNRSDSDLIYMCLKCEPGTFTAADATFGNCTSCGPGTAAATEGSSFCSKCPVGQYSAGQRATSCVPCQGGFVTPEPGATSASQCLSPLSNFLSAAVALVVSLIIAAIYLGSQRFRLVAQLRCLRVWSVQMAAYCAAHHDVKAHATTVAEALWQRSIEQKIVLADSGETRTDQLLAVLRILNFCLWAVLSVGVIIVGTAIVFCLLLLRVFVGSLILWKQTKSVYAPRDFSSAVKQATSDIFAGLGSITGLGVLWSACEDVFVLFLHPLLDVLASFKFKVNLGVTCIGSGGPIELLIDICVLGCVIVAVESGMQAARCVLSAFLIDYTKTLVSGDYRQHCTRRLLTRTQKARWYFSNAFALTQTVLVWAASNVLNVQTLCQYLLSLCQFSSMVQQSGRHPYSEACNHVTGLENLDYTLAVGATWAALVTFLPAVYCIASVLYPANDSLWDVNTTETKAESEINVESCEAASTDSSLSPPLDKIPSASNKFECNVPSHSTHSNSQALLFRLSYWLQAIGCSLSSDLHLAAGFEWALERFRAHLALKNYSSNQAGARGQSLPSGSARQSSDTMSRTLTENPLTASAKVAKAASSVALSVSTKNQSALSSPAASASEAAPAAASAAAASEIEAEDDDTNGKVADESAKYARGTFVNRCPPVTIQRVLAPVTAGSPDSLRLTSRLGGLPSYSSLLCLEVAEIRSWNSFNKLMSNAGVAILLPVFLAVVPIGHVVTKVGRRAWGSVAAKYFLFLRAACGFVGPQSVRAFEIVAQAEAMRSGLDSKTRVNRRYADALYSSLAPRAVLLQVVPQLTPLSLFAIATAHCAIFSPRDSGLQGRLFDLLISDPFTRAYEENSGWRYSDQQWANVLGGISIFLLDSRLMQWVLSVYIILMSIALLFLPNSPALLVSAVLILLPFSFAYSIYGVVILGKAMGVRDLTAILCPSDGEMAMIRALKDDSKGRGVLVEMLTMRKRFQSEQEAALKKRARLAFSLAEPPLNERKGTGTVVGTPSSVDLDTPISDKAPASSPALQDSSAVPVALWPPPPPPPRQQQQQQQQQELEHAPRGSEFPLGDIYERFSDRLTLALPQEQQQQEQQQQPPPSDAAPDESSSPTQSQSQQQSLHPRPSPGRATDSGESQQQQHWASPVPYFYRPSPVPVAIPADARANLRRVGHSSSQEEEG